MKHLRVRTPIAIAVSTQYADKICEDKELI